jgi:hypothetical protein
MVQQFDRIILLELLQIASLLTPSHKDHAAALSVPG